MLTLLLGLVLLGSTGWVLGCRAVDGRLAEIVVAAWVCASAEVVLLTLLLGELGLLRRWWMILALAIGLASVICVERLRPSWSRRPAMRALGPRLREIVGDPLLAGLGAVTVAALAYALALGLATPPNDIDSLVYHLPRAVLWLQQGHVGLIPG